MSQAQEYAGLYINIIVNKYIRSLPNVELDFNLNIIMMFRQDATIIPETLLRLDLYTVPGGISILFHCTRKWNS